MKMEEYTLEKEKDIGKVKENSLVYPVILFLFPILFITVLPGIFQYFFSDPWAMIVGSLMTELLIGGSIYLLLGIGVYYLVHTFPSSKRTPILIGCIFGIFYAVLINILYFIVLKYAVPTLLFWIVIRSSLNISYIVLGVSGFLLWKTIALQRKEKSEIFGKRKIIEIIYAIFLWITPILFIFLLAHLMKEVHEWEEMFYIGGLLSYILSTFIFLGLSFMSVFLITHTQKNIGFYRIGGATFGLLCSVMVILMGGYIIRIPIHYYLWNIFYYGFNFGCFLTGIYGILLYKSIKAKRM